MERIWLKQYPPGVPSDIDVTQYSSLVELLEESFAKFADRRAFICMDKSISYRELDEMSRALAAFLQSKGLPKGARVALMMPNVLQYPVATAAVLRAGYTVVNVNPLYTPRELEHQLKASGATTKTAPTTAKAAASARVRTGGRSLRMWVVVLTWPPRQGSGSWRRGWDSNPRSFDTRPLSRRLH